VRVDADPPDDRSLAALAEPVVDPALPTFAEITDETKAAMAILPDVVGVVRPSESRVLTDEEVVALFKEQSAVRTVVSNLADIDENIKEIVRHHIDRKAEEDNRVVRKAVIRNGEIVSEATPRDQHGHYLLARKGEPEQVVVPGTGMAYSQEYREGAAAIGNATVELLDLYDRGEITREQYLALTKSVRQYDETKAMAAMSADPETYIPIIATITHKPAAGQSLFIRKAKAK
jgi:hypothetical protein